MDISETQFWGVMVAVIAVIASIVFNLINKRYQKKQLQITTLFHVFETLSSQDIRDARKFVYDEYHLLKKEGKPIIFNRTPFLQQQADKVKSSFDRVSVLVHDKLIDDELFFKLYGGIVIRSWKALEEDIANDRELNPVYCEDFKKLKKWCEKRYTPETMPQPYQRQSQS